MLKMVLFSLREHNSRSPAAQRDVFPPGVAAVPAIVPAADCVWMQREEQRRWCHGVGMWTPERYLRSPFLRLEFDSSETQSAAASARRLESSNRMSLKGRNGGKKEFQWWRRAARERKLFLSRFRQFPRLQVFLPVREEVKQFII